MEPIPLKGGRTITAIDEDDLPSDLFFRFQAIAAKNLDNPADATRWLMMRLFLVSGEPLTLDHLTERPPIGLGMRAIAQMNQYVTALIRGVPDPKASLDSADLQAGG